MSKKAEHGEREHISLYRAYRPHTFADVRGQDHIVTVLTQAIERETIGHAYLRRHSRHGEDFGRAHIRARRRLHR
jgi:replication-associated recombination protein RarA